MSHRMSHFEPGISKKLQNIPEELQVLRQWIGYLLVPQDGRKPKKLPIDPKSGKAAKVNDSATWATFNQAVQGLKNQNYQNIGFVFCADDPYFGVDQDNVRDSTTGVIEMPAQQIAVKLQTYTE